MNKELHEINQRIIEYCESKEIKIPELFLKGVGEDIKSNKIKINIGDAVENIRLNVDNYLESDELFKDKIESQFLGAVYMGYHFGEVMYMKDGEIHYVDAIKLLLK